MYGSYFFIFCIWCVMDIILLFYKYVTLEYPEMILKWQKELCLRLGLKGRILLAKEGINGTVAGSKEATQEYVDAMNAHPLFGNIDFKTSPGSNNDFPRMKVVIKNEIVRLGIDSEKVNAKDTATHLTPEQAHELINNPPKDFVIFDTRNDYETRIGSFRNAVNPPIKTFRELPEFIDKNEDLFKDKTVLMDCTGGVRCERASVYLQQKGIAKEIYQIEGGIHRYIEKFPDGHFRGSNYVFDARISQKANDDILSHCDICPAPSDYYTNCMNAQCNKQFLVCPACIELYQESCGKECFDLIQKKAVIIRKKSLRKPIPEVQ